MKYSFYLNKGILICKKKKNRMYKTGAIKEKSNPRGDERTEETV
jgi:hypothetical protein